MHEISILSNQSGQKKFYKIEIINLRLRNGSFMAFFIFLLSVVPLGCITQNNPSILLMNGFVSDCEKKPYQDKLCMFRALAYDLYGSVELQHRTMELMHMFLSATRRDDETFPGLHEDDIPVLESPVDRNLQSYSIFLMNKLKCLLNLLVAPRRNAQRQLRC